MNEVKKNPARLRPVLPLIHKKGLSLAKLGELCNPKVERGGIPYRFRVGDCMMADMAEMARAAGYKFVWHWEDVHPVEPSARLVRAVTSYKSDLLLPVMDYLALKNISLPDLGKKLGLSGSAIGYRIRNGVCMMSQMEEMAEAAGYKFVWGWEEIPETSSDSSSDS